MTNRDFYAMLNPWAALAADARALAANGAGADQWAEWFRRVAAYGCGGWCRKRTTRGRKGAPRPEPVRPWPTPWRTGCGPV